MSLPTSNRHIDPPLKSWTARRRPGRRGPAGRFRSRLAGGLGFEGREVSAAPCLLLRAPDPAKTLKFAGDSPLEEDGFELVVPLSKRTAVPSSPFGFRLDGTGYERSNLRKRRFEFPAAKVTSLAKARASC
jgi:hypothetical protein